jgi:predicted GIY-YIG superfamily endonuclease
LTLAISQEVGSRSAASKAEWAVKQLSKTDKEALIAGRLSLKTLAID